MNQSQAIVDFIANLIPLYDGEGVEGVWCARALSDGTLILPLEGDGECDAFVTVRWQGDPLRTSQVLASLIATLAVGRYVEFHSIAKTPKETRIEIERLAEHYRFKTGNSLHFETIDPALADLVSKAISRLGEAAVIEALKKVLGM